MNEDDWKDLADDEWGDSPDDTFVVGPSAERPDGSGESSALPVFRVLYGPAGAVRADLARAHRQMNLIAAVSLRPREPRHN